jgi:hypothetical protein
MLDGVQAVPELAETRKWVVKQTSCGASHVGWRASCTRTSGDKEVGGEADILRGRPCWMVGRLYQN